jgi:hypothetical protein
VNQNSSSDHLLSGVNADYKKEVVEVNGTEVACHQPGNSVGCEDTPSLKRSNLKLYFTIWLGDALVRIARSRRADAGDGTFPSRTISLALNSFP